MALKSKPAKVKSAKKAARKAAPKTTPLRRRPRPPVAEPRPQSRVVHGVKLTDEYAWLRAPNWQEVLRDPDALPKDIRKLIERGAE